jgi:hypothetical protein
MKGEQEVKSKETQQSGNLRPETRKADNRLVGVSVSWPRPLSRMCHAVTTWTRYRSSYFHAPVAETPSQENNLVPTG